MGLLKNRIIKMGCDFWIDTEEDVPSVVTRMTTTIVGHNKRRNIQNKIPQRNTRKVL